MVVLNHNCPDEHLSLEDRGTDMAAALRPSIQFLAVLSMSLLLCGFSEEAERVWKGGSGRASWLCHTQAFLITQALSVRAWSKKLSLHGFVVQLCQ